MSISMTMKTTPELPVVGLTRARFVNIIAAGYLFFTIVRPAEYWQFLMDYPFEKVMVLLFIFTVALTGSKKWHSSPMNLAVLMTMMAILACTAASPFPGNGLDAAYKFLRLFILYYLLQMILVDERSLKEIALAFIIITSLYMYKSAWEFFVNGRHFYRMGFARMVGMDMTYGDPNAFAATCAYSAPLALALYRYFAHNTTFRYYIWGHYTLTVLCLVFSGSRSGQLTFGLWVFMQIMRGGRKALKLSAAFVLVGLLMAVTPGDYSRRMLSTFDSSQGPTNAAVSAELRSVMFSFALSLFANRPLTGTGPDTFHMFSPGGLKPHNLYGQVLSETGLLGGLSFAFFLYCLFSANRRALLFSKQEGNRQTLTGLLAVSNMHMAILLLFNGMASHNFYRYHWVFIAAMSVGCLHASMPPKPRFKIKGGIHA